MVLGFETVGFLGYLFGRKQAQRTLNLEEEVKKLIVALKPLAVIKG